MNSLLWKQWRESRVYLAIFIAWMIIAVCYSIGYELGFRYRAAVGSFSGFSLLYTSFAAIVLAMRASRGEQTSGTIGFSASLPVSLQRVATVRIFGAVATLAIPIVFAAGILSLALISGLIEQVEPRGADPHVSLPVREVASLATSLEQLGSVTVIAVLGGVELLLLLSFLGCYLRNQAQVGLMGAVMALGLMIASSIFWEGDRKPYAQLIYGILLPQSLVVHWGYADERGGYTDHELAPFRWISLGLAIPLLAILARLFVARYGRLEEASTPVKPRRFRIAIPPILSRIPIRLPGRWAAMIWLELRQSVPLALFGFLFAVLVSVAIVLIERPYTFRYAFSLDSSVLKEMPHNMFFVGILWAAVVGSSLYAADLGSGLGGFWRSRPISPGMWFWTKFVIGLVAVVAVLDGTTILVSWNAARDIHEGMGWAYVGCFPILHSLVYALAVLGTCWLRRPVIGGILAILGFFVLTTAITTFPTTNPLEPIGIFSDLSSAERAGRLDFTQRGYPLVYGAMVVAIVLSALLSSRLARPLQSKSRWFSPVAA